MSNQWAETLVSAGMNDLAMSDEHGAVVALDNALQAQLVDLSRLSVVDISGDDAAAFLQGQFSNDLGKVSPMRAQMTGYCTPKGRLLALPLIVGIEGGYRLLLPADIRDGFVKRLSMFIMRAKVTVSVREDWLCTGIVAADDGSLGPFTEFTGALPAAVMDAASSTEQQVVRWHDLAGSAAGSRARYLVIADRERQLELWRSATQATVSGSALWRLGDIRAGIPSITSGVQESFVPQMLNLQLIDGLSFTKGCYPGQEIVARMQYLGKLKRHMRRFSAPVPAGEPMPVAGDSLTAGAGEDAGVVVDAVAGPEGQIELLAVVKVSATDSDLLCNGQPVTAVELPYELPSLSATSQTTGS